MDYKKLHKETLEKLQQIVFEGRMTEEVAKYICPDFVTESEDERIRKVLVDMVKRETGFIGFPSQAQVLAYLEKQKETTKEELYAEAGTTEKEDIANTMKMVRAIREKRK